MDFIPLTFMLGFFVTIIVRRWNDIFANLGWVEKLVLMIMDRVLKNLKNFSTAITVANYIRGTDDRTRMIRRNVIRYMVLAQVLVFRDCSIQVRKRFPTMESIVSAGSFSQCLGSSATEYYVRFHARTRERGVGQCAMWKAPKVFCSNSVEYWIAS